ncbi:MAG: protein O-mannosyl-transferase family [Armatimonadota bacterium]
MSSRTPWLCAGAVFVVLLAIYQATMLRTVVDIDSGELVAAAHVQGIPHPTGYPLWLLLGRLFDYLPLGHSSAYRVGMMSGTGVAATGALITLVAASMTGQVIPALAAGVAFGLWSPPWGDSVRAMVHAITGLFVVLCIIAFRRWQRERSPHNLWVLSLAFGVAVMHHRTSALAVGFAFLAAFLLTSSRARWPLLALALLAAAALAAYAGSAAASLVVAGIFAVLLVGALVRRRAPATHLVSAALVVLPFSLYLYLWWRSLQHPTVYWSKLDTFSRLMYYLFAKHYGGFAFQHRGIQALEEAGRTLGQVLVPNAAAATLLFLIAAPLMLWGWWQWRRREPLAAWCMGAGAVLLGIWVAHWGESSDLKHFLTPAGPALALSGAIGMAHLARWRAVAGRAWIPSAVLSALMCGMLFAGNYPLYDFSNRWANRDRWAAAFEQMDRNAVLVSDFDQPSYVGMYLQNVEGLRRDVVLLRATRLVDEGYVELIPDPEVREAVRAIGSPPGFASEGDSHEWAAFFALQLAQRLRGWTVYGVHGSLRGGIEGPPYFTNVSEDLARVQFEEPRPVVRASTAADIAQFQNGAALVGFTLDRPEAGTGEMVGFTARWRLFQQLPASQFGVALVPPGMEPDDLTADRLRDTRLVQGFFFLNGLWGTPPSAAGMCYEQRGATIVPSNAPPGEYRVFVGLGHLYAESYVGWTEVGRLRVRVRPLPENGP